MTNDKRNDSSYEYHKYEHIAKEIALKIFNGEFNVKEPLPNETEMQQIFDVGRSVVRDSIKCLKSKGLLTTKTKVGTTICPINDWNYLDSQLVEWLMETPMRNQVYDYFFALRKLIEPEASALSAILLSDKQMKEFSSIWKAMEKLEKNFDHNKWVEYDLAFHEILYKGARNSLFTAFFEIYKVVWFSKLSQVSNECDICYVYHKDMYKAIVARDSMKAKNANLMLLEHASEYHGNTSVGKSKGKTQVKIQEKSLEKFLEKSLEKQKSETQH